MYAQLNSQVIYYEKTGSGPKDIVLLHGNGETHEIFTELADSLADHYTVYLPDTRGHGLSATPAEYHYRDMASDLINLVRFTGMKQPEVLGFSDGAITAMLAAIRENTMFSKLYLCGGNLSPKGLTFKATMEIKKEYRRTKSPMIGMMLSEPDIDPKDLSSIKAPVIVFAGQKDMIKETETKRIAESLPKAKLLILPGETHDSYVVHNARLKKYILQ